jgi:hypothetical protein
MKEKNEILTGKCNYYLIRLGISGDKKGDFIDHIDYPYNISIAHFTDDELLLIQGPNIDFCIENEVGYGEWVEKVVKKIIKKIKSPIPKNILMGLYQSTFENSDGGFVLNNCLNEDYDNFFQTSDQETIAQFGECFFGIGSVTNDLTLKINKKTGEIYYKDKSYKELSDLYGHIDEDDSWVVGYTQS